MSNERKGSFPGVGPEKSRIFPVNVSVCFH